MSCKILSISDVIRMESGKVIVRGMIASVSTLYKIISKSTWVCENLSCNCTGSQEYYPYLLLPPPALDDTNGIQVKCSQCKRNLLSVTHEFKNARTIQIEDSEKTENNDRLEVLLYDDASMNVIAGEIVDIDGELLVQRKIESGRGKKLVTILHSNKIRYKNKEEIVVTDKDIQIFEKWKKISYIAYENELRAKKQNLRWSKKIKPMTFMDRIIAMFSPNVIGHHDVKLGILRSLVGGREDRGNDNGRRGRVNTFLVGDPGTAKSLLARESTKLFSNSRYVTAQNASSKSLIAIVDKENDSLMLRLGALVLAKGSICAINEISALSFEDQQRLLDIAEEGRCTVDKYGTHFEIDCPTTIISTANPFNSNWMNASHIDKDEIPALKSFLDRFDQVYAFRDTNSEDELNEFANCKSSLRKRKSHNNNFLKKYLKYAKSLKPECSDDVEYRLNKFWINSKLQQCATNRTYDSLFRMAEAQAKLNLTEDIGDEILHELMESVSKMLSQYGRLVEIVRNPKEVTYIAFTNIVSQCGAPISIKELCKVACDENEQIRDYLGDKWSIEQNRRLKTVVEMLKNTDSISITSSRPLMFNHLNREHSSDLSDISDKI